MQTSATDRLEQLKADIEARQAAIESAREQYAETLTAGDEPRADKLAERIRDDEGKLSILMDRLPVLDDLVQQEAAENRATEAARLTSQANDARAEIKAHFDKVGKLAAQLEQAAMKIDENADLHWSILASKAYELGGKPITTEIEGAGDILAKTKNASARCQHMATAFSHKALGVVLSR